MMHPTADASRRLVVAAHAVGREIELEFVAASATENLEDQLVLS